MDRTLRLSPRPFIVFAILLGPLWAFTLISYLKAGRPHGELNNVLLWPMLYAVIMAAITSVRVTVRGDGILIKRWYFLTQKLNFVDITHSDVQILAEREWPMSISIHRAHNLAPVVLGLKVVRQEDATWFCSLPTLKPNVHLGLTKRRA